MPHPDETLLRDGHFTFAAQDIPDLLSIWDPNITWTESGHSTLTGTRKGPRRRARPVPPASSAAVA